MRTPDLHTEAVCSADSQCSRHEDFNVVASEESVEYKDIKNSDLRRRTIVTPSRTQNTCDDYAIVRSENESSETYKDHVSLCEDKDVHTTELRTRENVERHEGNNVPSAPWRFSAVRRMLTSWRRDKVHTSSDAESEKNRSADRDCPNFHESHHATDSSTAEETSLFKANATCTSIPAGATPTTRFRRMLDAITRRHRAAPSPHMREYSSSRRRSSLPDFPNSPSTGRSGRHTTATTSETRSRLERARISSDLQARRLASYNNYDSDDDKRSSVQAKPTPSALPRPPPQPKTSLTAWISSHLGLRRSRSSDSLSDSDEEDQAAPGLLGRARDVLQRLLARGGGGRDVAWTALPDATSPSPEKASRGASLRAGIGSRAREWLAYAERARRSLVRSSSSIARSDVSKEESTRLEASEDLSDGESDALDANPPAAVVAERRRRSRSCSDAAETVVEVDVLNRRNADETFSRSNTVRRRRTDRRVTWCIPQQHGASGDEIWELMGADVSTLPSPPVPVPFALTSGSGAVSPPTLHADYGMLPNRDPAVDFSPP